MFPGLEQGVVQKGVCLPMQSSHAHFFLPTAHFVPIVHKIHFVISCVMASMQTCDGLRLCVAGAMPDGWMGAQLMGAQLACAGKATHTSSRDAPNKAIDPLNRTSTLTLFGEHAACACSLRACMNACTHGRWCTPPPLPLIVLRPAGTIMPCAHSMPNKLLTTLRLSVSSVD